MTNTSATGGYLAPGVSPAPLEDAALFAFLQAIFVGITALPGNLVVPRWQQVPPNQPAVGTAWMAFGITDRAADTFSYETHDSTGDGVDYTMRNEVLTILCSFYGDTADTNAALTRDGLQVGQNREALQLNNMALVDCGRIVAAPAIMNSQWVYRVDMEVRIRRAIVRTYPILNLLSAAGTVTDSSGFESSFNAEE